MTSTTGIPIAPNMAFPNTIAPFRYFCQKVLPAVYDDSLSYYELLCKVVKYLNTTLDNVNQLNENMQSLNAYVVELQKWVDEYFSNLDVQEEINNRLDEWAVDGTLKRLFGEHIRMDDAAPYLLSMNFGGRKIVSDLVDSGYSSVQAGVKVDDSYVFAVINYNLLTAMVTRISLVDGSILARNVVEDAGHFNGCAYDGNRIAFVKSFGTSAGGNSKEIVLLNSSNLTVSETVTVNEVEEQIIGLGYDAGTWYVLCYNYFYAYDSEFNYVSKTAFQFPQGYVGRTVRQGGLAYNGRVGIIVNNENTIMFFKADSGAFDYALTLGQFQGAMPLGEVENACIVDNELWVNSNVRGYTSSRYLGCWIFHANLNKGGYQSDFGALHSQALERMQYYVDNTKDEFLPTGEEAHPFNALTEALICASSPNIASAIVYAVNSTYDENIRIANCNVQMQMRGSTIRSLTVVDSIARISSCTINGYLTYNDVSGIINAPLGICVRESMLSLGNVSVNDNSTDGFVKMYVSPGSTVDIFSQETPIATFANSEDIVNYGHIQSTGTFAYTSRMKMPGFYKEMTKGDSVTIPADGFVGGTLAIPGIALNRVPFIMSLDPTALSLNDYAVYVPSRTNQFIVKLNYDSNTNALTYENCYSVPWSGGELSEYETNIRLEMIYQ